MLRISRTNMGPIGEWWFTVDRYMLFGIIFLEETLNWKLVVGGIMTISGVAVIVLRRSSIVPYEKLLTKQRNDKP